MCAAAIGRAGTAPPPQWAEGSAGTRCTRVLCEVLGEYFVKASEAVWKHSLLSPRRSPLPTRVPCGVLCEYFVSASEAVGKRSLPSPSAPFAYSGTLWGTL
jgi:hypothetical protein